MRKNARVNSSFEEEGMAPLEKGRGRYQRKDYAGALEAFNQAVAESSDFLLLNALDHRAAAYEKMEQYQPALKDSKRMIDLKPEASKGYLRCGKVLQLKGENELALKIYERGLNKVKVGTDDQRTLLQKIYSKLRAVQDPGRNLDPLHFFPLELAQMICQFLTMRDRVACLAVSKGWKRVLESMHSLWMILDTSSTRKPINLQSLKAYLKRSNYALDHAIITTRASLDSYKLSYITRTCKFLKSFEMRGSGIIDSSLESMLPAAHCLQTITICKGIEVPLSAVGRALRDCQKTLTHVSFQGVRGTRGGVLGYDFSLRVLINLDLRAVDLPFLDIEKLQAAAPHLRNVHLANWRFTSIPVDLTPWTQLESLKMTNTELLSIPPLPPTLKHLYLDGFFHIRHTPTEDGLDLPLLETLSVQDSLHLSQLAVSDIVNRSNNIGNLKTLDLSGRLHVNGYDVVEQYMPSKSLVSLGLSRMRIGDKAIMAIAELYPNLKQIGLEETRVTGIGLKTLVERGLQSINVNHCDELGADAVLWARAQGVDVQHNMMRRLQPRRYRDILADQ